MVQDVFLVVFFIAIAAFVILAARSRSATSGGSPDTERWTVSVSGNPTMIIGGNRVTVFQSDGGWKFVTSPESSHDEEDAFFSEPYATEEQAKYEALAFIKGRPALNKSMKEIRDERREEQRQSAWEDGIRDRDDLIADTVKLLNREDLNVTTMRKPEKRIASHLKALEWQIPHHQGWGASPASIARGERQRDRLRELAKQLETRIAAKKAERVGRSKGKGQER